MGVKKNNLLNKKFGKLTVVEKIPDGGRAKWLCRCDCGETKIIMGQSLVSGASTSCGCSRYKYRKAVNLIDLVGKKFGKLTVMSKSPSPKSSKNKLARWLCVCQCGNTTTVTGSALRQGKTKSCGCLKIENLLASHNARWTGYKEISGSFWERMKRSAKSKNRPFTITIEQAWELFMLQDRRCAISGIPLTFVRDRRRKFEQTASLDRIDNKIGYVNGNIQWIHREINFMKNVLSQDKFFEWCKIITEYQSSANIPVSYPSISLERWTKNN